MPRGPRNLRIFFEAEALTHYGGAILLYQFFQRIGLRTLLCRAVRFPQRNHRYHISETLLALLHPIILGMGRLEVTEPLKRNGVFQYLTGRPRYPDSTSLRRFLQRFARAGRSGFLKLHDRLRTGVLASLGRQAILDLDSTVLTVYRRQEQAAIGYNPRKRGRASYLAFLCFEGQTRDCLEGTLHPGNTHVLSLVQSSLQRVMRKLPRVRRLCVRADGAFYDGRFRDWLIGHRAQYVIAARLTKPLKHRLGALRYRQVRRDLWTAEFRYTLQGWSAPQRFIVIRRPVPEEPSAQPHLFEVRGYTYQVLVTHLSWTPLHVWQFYNDRSQAELVIRELKAAYALDKIPTQDFAGNEAFFQLVLFAYNLLNWFKRLCTPPSLQRASLQRLRRQLFLVPAQLVRPQGRPVLRLAQAYVSPALFQDTLQRIRRLRPVLAIQ